MVMSVARQWLPAAALAALAVLGAMAPALAQRQVYDLSIRGLHAATISLDTDAVQGGYKAAGEISPAGLVGVFFDFRFRGNAEGARQGAMLLPTVYYGSHVIRDRVRHTTIRYDGDSPAEVAVTPAAKPRPYDVDPLAQSGAVDPVTAAAELLADRPAEQACARTVQVFDGRRRSVIAVATPRPVDDRMIACDGVYSRLAGYSEKELQKQRSFPFVMYLELKEGMARVVRFQTESIYGTAAAVRR